MYHADHTRLIQYQKVGKMYQRRAANNPPARLELCWCIIMTRGANIINVNEIEFYVFRRVMMSGTVVLMMQIPRRVVMPLIYVRTAHL